MALGDSHRLFLQGMMSRGAVSEAEARDLYLKATQSCNERGDSTLFPGFVSSLNNRLKPLGMHLAHSTMEDSPIQWYALVNHSQDPAAKIASGYSPAELELFNKVMEHLVLEGEGLASSTVLLNASSQMERKITHRDAQAFLKSLVKDKWLSEVVKELFAQNVFYRQVVSVMFALFLQSQGVYGAGPRFILELRPFLREIFGEEEIANCHICKEPVIRGQCCGNQHCQVKLHLYCIAKLARARGTCRCPGCHSNWPHDIPEIEDEVDANNGSPSQSRNPPSPPSQRTQRKRTRHGAYKH